MKTATPPINVRLFDLVRYMRSELHHANLITDEEYAWLIMEAPLAQGVGSPSPRRLEDYDDIRAKLKNLAESWLHRHAQTDDNRNLLYCRDELLRLIK
jgi:hypothetical protein